jgi:hypothetical protein
MQAQNSLSQRGVAKHMLCVAFLLPTIAGSAQEATLVRDERTVNALKEAVMAWAAGLESMTCVYRLQSNNYSPGDENPHEEYLIEYRYQGGNIFLNRRTVRGPSVGEHMIEAVYEGAWSYRLVKDEADPERMGEVEIDRPGGWPWPPRVWLMPHEVYLQETSKGPLNEILQQGTLLAFALEGGYVLSHWRGQNDATYDVDVHISKDMRRVTRIEWVRRFGRTPSQMAEIWEGPLLTARLVSKYFVLDDYRDVNGVEVPTDVREVIHGDASGALEERTGMLNSGQLTFPAYVREVLSLGGDAVSVAAERSMRIDPAQLAVNIPLTRDDFEIPLAVGDVYVDYRASDAVRYVRPWYFRPWFFVTMAIALLGALGYLCLQKRRLG